LLLGPYSKIVVHSASLIKQLEDAEGLATDSLNSLVQALQLGWGLPSKLREVTETVLPRVLNDLEEIYARDGPEILKNALRKLEQEIPNMITFSDSVVDQEYWERMSMTSLVESDEEVVETSLM
jgi:hypothetical protein